MDYKERVELVIISAISSLTFFSLMIVLPSTFIEFQHKASILLNKVEICRVGFGTFRIKFYLFSKRFKLRESLHTMGWKVSWASSQNVKQMHEEHSIFLHVFWLDYKFLILIWVMNLSIKGCGCQQGQIGPKGFPGKKGYTFSSSKICLGKNGKDGNHG